MRVLVVCGLMAAGMTAAGAVQHAQHEHPAQAAAGATSALTAEQVQQLLAGDGMGLAKAAELNGYPGPKHILERAGHLSLSDAQRERIVEIRARMLEKARHLGRAIVDAERALDDAFASKRIDAAGLAARTKAIGALQAELRAAHLGAHLESVTVLTPEQVKVYYAHGKL
jgi:Spy/CpxP family protein refolding chaperone